MNVQVAKDEHGDGEEMERVCWFRVLHTGYERHLSKDISFCD